METGKFAVRVQNLSKDFGQERVLNSVSRDFEQEKIHGIVGNNGSGKTVLMQCNCGFLIPTEGVVTVNGKRVGRDVDFPPAPNDMPKQEVEKPELFISACTVSPDLIGGEAEFAVTVTIDTSARSAPGRYGCPTAAKRWGSSLWRQTEPCIFRYCAPAQIREGYEEGNGITCAKLAG